MVSGKRDVADVTKVINLKIERFSWVIWVDPI